MAVDVVKGQIVRVHYMKDDNDHDSWRWGIVKFVDDTSYVVEPFRGGNILFQDADNPEVIEKFQPHRLAEDYKPDLVVEKPTIGGKPLMAKKTRRGYRYPKHMLEVL